MNKGSGQSPQGVRWVMRSLTQNEREWVTQGRYIEAEVLQWECAKPVRPYMEGGNESR